MRFVSIFYIGVLFMLLSITEGALAAQEDLAKGNALYLKYCEVCHGSEGKGDGYLLFDPPVADLTSPAIQSKSDSELWQSVHDGVQNTAMGMGRFVLSDEEIVVVLKYVRSLGQ